MLLFNNSLIITNINFYSQITITKHMNFNKIDFFNSYNNLNNLPNNINKEIAIIGSSNVGKSSLLNFFSNNKKLSFISKNPGRTKNFNFFQYEEKIYFVDLPGYGYTKTSKIINFKFNKLIYKYIKNRKKLLGLILIMDIRYPIKRNDLNIIEFIIYNKKKVHVILNKSDKINKYQASLILNKTYLFFKKYDIELNIQILSTKTNVGKKNLFSILNKWIN